MITAEIDQFGAFLVVRGDDEETELAAENAPAWVGKDREWRTDGSLWMALCTVALPSCEAVAAWCADVNERMTA